MTTYSFPYGMNHVNLDIPDRYHTDLIVPAISTASKDQIQSIEKAIESPVKLFNIPKWSDIQNVAIAINDKTRPVPHQLLLPPLLKWLHQNGLEARQIKFHIATGTHLPMPDDEFKSILPDEIIQKYAVISHNCDDIENLVFIGNTTQNTPIFVNRLYHQSDLKIVVGNIEPHHFMGFSGGAKSVAIGLTGRDTINRNHAMLVNPLAKVGEYDHNPMRQDVEEIGEYIGIHLALNVILNSDKEIVHALFGKPRDVMEAGVPLSRAACQVEAPHLYDLVIASAGGYPKDINLYQSQKAITHAALITRDQGIVILAAECREGSGSKSFEEFISDIDSSEDVFRKFKKLGFKIGPHKAFQIAQQASRIQIILISSLKPDSVRKYLLTPAENIGDAFNIAIKSLSENPRIAVVPKATSTIPYLRSNAYHE